MQPKGHDRARVPSPRPVRRALTTGAAILLLAVAAAGCSSEELPRLGFPTPATRDAERVLSLWQGSWAAALAVGAVVWGLIVWSVIFHRKRSDALPTQTRYNVPIEALYTVVPFIMIAVLFFFTARDESKLIALTDNPEHEVNVVGRQWSWTFNYLDADTSVAGSPGQPPTLVLPQGERVRFTLTSPDVIHSFWVPSFLFKLDVVPGRQNEFEVTPSKLGTYRGKCAELCGVDHSRMLFNVVVVTPDQYDRYLDELRAKGQVVTSQNAPTVSTENAQ
ncbi:MAG: aa3-type cytochrome oxidase subunit II [Actinomycetes bacterium]